MKQQNIEEYKQSIIKLQFQGSDQRQKSLSSNHIYEQYIKNIQKNHLKNQSIQESSKQSLIKKSFMQFNKPQHESLIIQLKHSKKIIQKHQSQRILPNLMEQQVKIQSLPYENKEVFFVRKERKEKKQQLPLIENKKIEQDQVKTIIKLINTEKNHNKILTDQLLPQIYQQNNLKQYIVNKQLQQQKQIQKRF